MIGTPAHVIGSSYAPPTDLPVGTVFWRLHPSTVTSVTSPTWQFTVGARSAPVDSSWGTTLDVNGDGFADVVVGAPFVNNNDTGVAYVYLGGTTGLATTPATTLIGTDVPYGHFGSSVASAGDVNGDGFGDLIVAAVEPGILFDVYIYFGSATGLAATPPGTLSVMAPWGPVGWAISVAGAGDVNGDGYADVFVGACSAELCGNVYLGSAGGVVPTPATRLLGFGMSAGDVNGDGYGDVVAKGIIEGTDGVYPVAYSVSVYLGSAAGLATVPAAEATNPNSRCFGDSFASAGDVNGDGFADVVVGAPNGCIWPNSAPEAAYMYLGNVTGFATPPAATLAPTLVGSLKDGGSSGFATSVCGASD
jgi:hypothetical protein